MGKILFSIKTIVRFSLVFARFSNKLFHRRSYLHHVTITIIFHLISFIAGLQTQLDVIKCENTKIIRIIRSRLKARKHSFQNSLQIICLHKRPFFYFYSNEKIKKYQTKYQTVQLRFKKLYYFLHFYASPVVIYLLFYFSVFVNISTTKSIHTNMT